SPWVAIVDADDAWLTEKLERQLACVEKHPHLPGITTDGAYVTEHEVLRESWLSDYFTEVQDMAGDLFPSLVQRCFPLLSSRLVLVDAYHAVGGFDVTIQFSQDYDLWLRLAARYPGGVLADRL